MLEPIGYGVNNNDAEPWCPWSGCGSRPETVDVGGASIGQPENISKGWAASLPIRWTQILAGQLPALTISCQTPNPDRRRPKRRPGLPILPISGRPKNPD
jgi:hypothetical protein